MEFKIKYVTYTLPLYKYKFGAYADDPDFFLSIVPDGNGNTKEEAAEDLRCKFNKVKDLINSIILVD